MIAILHYWCTQFASFYGRGKSLAKQVFDAFYMKCAVSMPLCIDWGRHGTRRKNAEASGYCRLRLTNENNSPVQTFITKPLNILPLYSQVTSRGRHLAMQNTRCITGEFDFGVRKMFLSMCSIWLLFLARGIMPCALHCKFWLVPNISCQRPFLHLCGTFLSLYRTPCIVRGKKQLFFMTQVGVWGLSAAPVSCSKDSGSLSAFSSLTWRSSLGLRDKRN